MKTSIPLHRLSSFCPSSLFLSRAGGWRVLCAPATCQVLLPLSPSAPLCWQVDADAHRSLGEKFGVRGFPTIKWFPRGKPSDPVE